MIIKENIKGMDYFKLALLAFVGLGLEVILIFIEPFIYGQPVDFKTWTAISHWSITYVLWGISIALILLYAKNRLGFKIRGNNAQIKLWQWLAVVALVCLSLFISYRSWGGFKLQQEFVNLGTVKFIFQYIYYFIETVLFTLIIVFGQKAFEKWFKREDIPYGGIICALTWGIAHIFTKTSLEAGILSAIAGFGFGAVYLLLNRDMIKTFPIIFLMFIL